jgi:hypothetical protein
MNDIFNESEVLELEKLNDNPVLLSGLKKIFLADIYTNGVLDKEQMGDEYKRNFAFSLSFDAQGRELARTNEDLGKALRACNEALRIVSNSFSKISTFKKISAEEVKKPNKAR